jgi:hypothetical protein
MIVLGVSAWRETFELTLERASPRRSRDYAGRGRDRLAGGVGGQGAQECIRLIDGPVRRDEELGAKRDPAAFQGVCRTGAWQRRLLGLSKRHARTGNQAALAEEAHNVPSR